jgi:hypothetical protein
LNLDRRLACLGRALHYFLPLSPLGKQAVMTILKRSHNQQLADDCRYDDQTQEKVKGEVKGILRPEIH